MQIMFQFIYIYSALDINIYSFSIANYSIDEDDNYYNHQAHLHSLFSSSKQLYDIHIYQINCVIR